MISLIEVSAAPYCRRDQFTVVGVSATGEEYVYNRVFKDPRSPLTAQIEAELVADEIVRCGMMIDPRDWSRSEALK